MKLRELYALDLNELTFQGSQCTKDCSGHRAGYKWSLDRGGVENPASPSQSFINGANIGVRNLKARTQGGGKIAGYTSQSANAIRKREARLKKKLELQQGQLSESRTKTALILTNKTDKHLDKVKQMLEHRGYATTVSNATEYTSGYNVYVNLSETAAKTYKLNGSPVVTIKV